MLHPGLYEQVINTKLRSELAEIPQARRETAPIGRAEASRVLSQCLADIVQKGLDNVLDNGGDIAAQVALTNQIVTLIQNSTQEADSAALSVAEQAEQLLALLREAGPRLAAGTFIIGSAAPRCCCLCGSSRPTAWRAEPRPIPTSARPAMCSTRAAAR